MISLSSSPSISDALELASQLQESLLSGEPIELEGSSVERVDTATLQLLCAFARSARAEKIPLKWIRPSEELMRSARLLGLTSELALDPHATEVRIG